MAFWARPPPAWPWFHWTGLDLKSLPEGSAHGSKKTHPVYLKKARLLKGKQSSYTTIPMGMVHINLTWRVDFYGKFWEIYHIWRLWEWLKVALIIMVGYFLGGYVRMVGWVAIYTTGENDVWVFCLPVVNPKSMGCFTCEYLIGFQLCEKMGKSQWLFLTSRNKYSALDVKSISGCYCLQCIEKIYNIFISNICINKNINTKGDVNFETFPFPQGITGR